MTCLNDEAELETMLDFIVLELSAEGDDCEIFNDWDLPTLHVIAISSQGREFLTARGVIWSGSYAGFRHGTVLRTRVDEIEDDAVKRHNMAVGFASGDFDGEYLIMEYSRPGAPR